MSESAYIKMPIECPHCNAKQEVHVRSSAQLSAGSMPLQEVACLKCKKDFNMRVPDKIIDGPLEF